MPKRSKKLSKIEIEKMFYQLCVAVTEIKNYKEAAEFLRDLISYPEAEMIAKRLKIAEMILNDSTYEKIKKDLGVGFGTIARVQEWLNISGDGYRRAVDSIKKSKPIEVNSRDCTREDLDSIKRRYPMYYWPEIVLENIVKNMRQRDRKRVEIVIKEMGAMKKKTQLYRQLKKMGF